MKKIWGESGREVEPVVARVPADLDHGHVDRMVPVRTPCESLAVVKSLFDRLGIGLRPSEDVPLLGCGVREVFELDKPGRFREAWLWDRKEVTTALRRVVLRLKE